MTNTLHRYGSAESFADDYIVFATPSNGRNEIDSLPKLKKFLELALPFKPVNIGDPVHGGALRPGKDLHTSANWKRDMTPDFRAVIDGLSEPATVVAIFDNQVFDYVSARARIDADQSHIDASGFARALLVYFENVSTLDEHHLTDRPSH